MRILCPNCGFDREMDEAKIPPRAQMATCPRCEHKFRFRVVDDLPPAEPGQDAPVPPTAGPAFTGAASDPDPMAAQRAAAEAAWRHLQGVKPGDAQDQARSENAAGGRPVRVEDLAPPASPSLDQTGAGQADENQADQNQTGQNQVGQNQAGQGYWTSGSAQPYAGSPVPFEDLQSHGFFPGLWETIRQVLTTPTAFFQSMPVSGGMGRPLVFHLLLAEFMVLCQYLWGLTSLGSLSQYAGSPELMDMGMGLAGAAPILILVFYPLLLILRLMFMTGVVHLLLRAVLRFTGGQGRGAEATFRVLCYSAAPLVLGFVPFFGPFLGGFWSIALTIIGLKAAHRTRASAAAFAVLVPILMMLAAVLGLMQSGMKV